MNSHKRASADTLGNDISSILASGASTSEHQSCFYKCCTHLGSGY